MDRISERRYERKRRVTTLEFACLRQMIWQHPARLDRLYPPRYINNVYLDTFTHSYFFDHVNGVPKRKKVRVRWYGELEGEEGAIDKLQLEIKTKDGTVMSKFGYPLASSCLDEMLRPDGLRELVNRSDCPSGITALVASLRPVLVNRYRREYFRTADKKVRITIDRDLRFYQVDRPRPQNNASYVDSAVIMEIKYDHRAVNEGVDVSSRFSIPLCKNSKYVYGMERFLGGS